MKAPKRIMDKKTFLVVIAAIAFLRVTYVVGQQDPGVGGEPKEDAAETEVPDSPIKELIKFINTFRKPAKHWEDAVKNRIDQEHEAVVESQKVAAEPEKSETLVDKVLSLITFINKFRNKTDSGQETVESQQGNTDVAVAKPENTAGSYVSRQCEEDVQMYLDGVAGRPRGFSTTPNWAKQMDDAYGGMQAGIFQNNMYWLGDFWQCLSIDVWRNNTRTAEQPPDFTGKYCLTSVIILFLGPLLNFKIGMCLPSSCSSEDFGHVVRKFYSFPLLAIVQDNFCQTRQWDAWDAISIGIGMLFALLGIIVVCGTIYELFLIGKQQLKSKNSAVESNILNIPCLEICLQKTGFTKQLWKSLLLTFSAHRNTKAVFDVHPKDNALGVVHGMRAISMAWVLVGHVFLVIHQSFPWKNQLKAVEFVKDTLFQVILMGEFSVDSFFCMSGFLIAYLFLKEMKRTNGEFNLLVYYFHRFWRLSPAYILTIAYMCAIYPHAGKGPIWPATYNDRNTCREKWWQNLLYINVYFTEYSDDKCLPQVWYLCLDVAYYIIAPVILYPLFKKPRLGKFIFLLFVIAAFLTPALLIHFENLASFPASNIESWQRDKFMVRVYDKPWGRMPAFLVGLVYGYIFYQNGRTMKMSRSVVASGWTVATGLGLWLIYGTIPYMRGEWEMSHGMFIFYGTFTRPLWAITVGWVILACATGYGGYVNSILSWRGFLPFSKLSYTIYLVHFTILAEFYASRPDSTYIDYYTMAFYTIYLFMWTLVVSLALTLIGEAPFITMEKLLFNFLPQTAPPNGMPVKKKATQAPSTGNTLSKMDTRKKK